MLRLEGLPYGVVHNRSIGREEVDYTSPDKFDALRQRLCAELPRLEIILDGEIIAIDDEGRIDFWGPMKGRGHLAYAAFDLLWLRGKDLRHLPLIQRKKRLRRLLPEVVGPLNLIPWFEENGRELFQATRQYDLEGIVAKRKADPYDTRTRWLKIKNPSYSQAEGRRELFERWGVVRASNQREGV